MRQLRGVAAGVMTLIMLQALGTGKGPENGGKLLVWVAGGVRRLLSPEVAGIPYVGAPQKRVQKKVKPPAGGSTGGGTSGGEIGNTMPRNPSVQV